jgi:hypothetical protein
MFTERQHRKEIVRYARMLHERAVSLAARMDGNLLIRLDRERILLARTRVNKAARRAGHMMEFSP